MVRVVFLSKYLVTAALFIGSWGQANFGVGPLVTYLQVEQGRTQTVLTVFNRSDSQSVRIRLETLPFTYEDGGMRFLDASEQADGRDLSAYVQFTPQEFLLEPSTNQRVRVVVTMPPSVEAGEYRTAIAVSPVRPDSDDVEDIGMAGEGIAQARTDINFRIASALYVHQGAKNVQMEASNAHWNEERLHLSVANVGNSSANARMQWQIERDGLMLHEGEAGGTVIPNTQRLIQLGRDLDLSSGRYVLRGTLTPTQGFQEFGSQDFELSFTVP